MNFILQKIKSFTKEDNVRNRHRYIKISCAILAVLLFICLPTEESLAASGLKIYNYSTKKESTYTGKQIKVTYNRSKISVDSTPGILVDGVALVSYKDIFANSPIDADCDYNSEKGTISISKYGTTILMTINSKKAYVNGNVVTMSVAPVKINYKSAGKIKILVPSRFVSETLGYGYTWYSSLNTVAIERDQDVLPLSYNNGRKFNYIGTQGVVTVDGQKLSSGKMPSIITNNTAMLRAKRVFADSKIDADYIYNKEDNSVTLTKNGNVLAMRIGSPVAYLNNNPIVLDTAPMIVHNYDASTSYVMVPGSFTASCLGFDYAWNKEKRTSIISSREDTDIPQAPDDNQSGNTVPDPELGDNGVVNTGTIVNEWTSNDTTLGNSSGITELNSDAVPSGSNGMILAVSRDYSSIKSNAETYVIYGNAPFGRITSTKSGQTIQISAAGMSSMDYSYQIYGSSGTLVNTVRTVNNSVDMSSFIEFNVMPGEFTYDLSLSEDNRTLYVTVYINSLTGVRVGTNNTGDFVTLTGSYPLDITINRQEGVVYIDLPYTINVVGNQNVMMSGTKYLTLLYSGGFTDKTQLILGVSTGCEYYISKDNNQYTINFAAPGTIPQPGNGTGDGSQPDNGSGQPAEDLPEIIDKSKYEILIPKPAGITKDQLSDEDDYYNNRFYIRIPGDHTAYFAANPITWNSSAINDITAFCSGNGETEVIVSTSRLQGYEIAVDNDYIYINTGEPREIYKNIVVLDPGHGGPANGAQYFGANEKDFNLKMLYEIGMKYFNSDTSKLKVYYTRETDVDIALKDRAAYAGKMGADVFVSLHMNASTLSGAYGTEVYYSENNNDNNEAGLNSKILASLFMNNLSSALGTNNRGFRSERYTVVYRNTVPAVLIELGFLSNKNDFALISDPAFQENAVKTIYEILLQVFELYPTGR